MSREGRGQPIQPFAAHGFLGNIPANGVLPQPLTVVDRVDQRVRFQPLPAIVLSGVLVPAPSLAVPPHPQAVEPDSRRVRFRSPPDPQTKHGFVASGVGVPGTGPPRPVNVDRADQRHRYRPLDPAVFNGLLASFGPAPAVTPPGPFVVPIEERRRFLSALPPTTLRGVDDVLPPRPASVEPDDRQRRLRPTIAPQALSGAYIVFLAPFVAPPAPFSLDRVDQRGRYRPLDPTVLSGILAPVAPPVATTTLTLTPHPFGGLVLLVHPFN